MQFASGHVLAGCLRRGKIAVVDEVHVVSSPESRDSQVRTAHRYFSSFVRDYHHAFEARTNGAGWRSWTFGPRLLCLVFLLTLPLVTPTIRGADEIQYFSLLRSLVFDHDLDFDNEYNYFYARDPQGLAGLKATFIDRREESTGRHISFGYLGPALMWSPFYVAAHGCVLVARAAGWPIAADGFAWPYAAAVCYGSAFYAFFGLLLTHNALRRFGQFAEPYATWSVLGIWLGTPLLYYMSLAPGFAHAPAVFAVSLLLWLWFRAREGGDEGVRAWALMGVAGGLAGLIRPSGALFLIAPAMDLAWRVLRDRRWAWGVGRMAVMGACAGVLLLPQLLLNRALTGGLGPTRLVTRKLSFSSPHFVQVLFDSGNGLFFWTPLALVAVAGLVAIALRRTGGLGRLLLVAFVLQVWINGSVESWTQAGAFGARRFVEMTPIFAWGLAAVLTWAAANARRLATASILAVFVWWNVSLMVQFGLNLMNRQRLEWPRVAINQIEEVPPRLARTLWLFLTDREALVRGQR
jgi:hypothetical protein